MRNCWRTGTRTLSLLIWRVQKLASAHGIHSWVQSVPMHERLTLSHQDNKPNIIVIKYCKPRVVAHTCPVATNKIFPSFCYT